MYRYKPWTKRSIVSITFFFFIQANVDVTIIFRRIDKLYILLAQIFIELLLIRINNQFQKYFGTSIIIIMDRVRLMALWLRSSITQPPQKSNFDTHMHTHTNSTFGKIKWYKFNHHYYDILYKVFVFNALPVENLLARILLDLEFHTSLIALNYKPNVELTHIFGVNVKHGMK